MPVWIPYANDAEWHELRRKHIGASEVAVLFGAGAEYHPSLFALWHDRKGNIPLPPIDNERTRWGKRLEAVVIEALAEETGLTHHAPRGYCSSDGLGATLDGITAPTLDLDTMRRFGHDAPPFDLDGPGVIEAKVADWLQHKRQWTDGEPPLHIMLQQQAQLEATGWNWGVTPALVGGNKLRLYWYQRRPEIGQRIRDEVAAFWAMTEPLVDGKPITTRILTDLYEPKPERLWTPLNDIQQAAFKSLCSEYLAASEMAKDIERRRDAAKNGLIDLLRDAGLADLDGYRVSMTKTPDNPGRVASPGEIVGARKSFIRVTVKKD